MPTSLIIGGRTGIGSIVKELLIKRGDKVYTASRSNSRENNHISCDITENCEPILSALKTIDNLVFTHRYRGKDWQKTFDVTITGVNYLIESLSSKFKKGGSVVIIGSNASRFILEEQPAEYHSSRSGLEGLVRYHSVKHGHQKIRFNCILPSTLIKPENKNFFVKDNPVRKMIEEITPLGRMGKAEDVGNLVEFLCSNKSMFLTGNSFLLDGGLSLVGQETIARNLMGLKHK